MSSFSSSANNSTFQAGSGAQRLYEAMYLYGLWLNYSTEYNISKRDGREMFKFTRDLSFEGKIHLLGTFLSLQHIHIIRRFGMFLFFIKF